MDHHWDYFNWPSIIVEAKMRHEYILTSTASDITPEMRTLEYWTAWVAHANATSVHGVNGQFTTQDDYGK